MLGTKFHFPAHHCFLFNGHSTFYVGIRDAEKGIAHPRKQLAIGAHFWVPYGLAGIIFFLQNSGPQPVGCDAFVSCIRYLAYQVFTLGFLTVVKLQLWNINENNCMAGVTTTGGSVLKGHSIRQVENCYSRASSLYCPAGLTLLYICSVLYAILHSALLRYSISRLLPYQSFTLNYNFLKHTNIPDYRVQLVIQSLAHYT